MIELHQRKAISYLSVNIGTVMVFRDITERKKAEEAM